jgi:surfactin synthase thioesterase subunit
VLSVAVSHGGAGAAAWAEVLTRESPDANFVAIRLPGRESRVNEPLAYQVEPLGAETAATIMSLLGRRRLVLAGVCFGAAVVHAAAGQLAEHFGIRPAALVVVDSTFGPPSEPPPPPDLCDPAFERYIRSQGLLPDWVWTDPVLSAMLLSQLHADMSAHAAYQWPENGTPRADLVIVVTGRRVDARSAAHWRHVANQMRVIHGGSYPHNLLVDEPVRLGEIISNASAMAQNGVAAANINLNESLHDSR